MEYDDLYLDFSSAPLKRGPELAGPAFECLLGRTPKALFEDRLETPKYPWTVSAELGASVHPRSDVLRQRPSPAANAGHILWRALPGAVRDAIASPPVEGRTRRIWISSRSDLINDMPWESLSDGERLFATTPKYVLLRAVPTRQPSPPQRVQQRRALVMASQPPGKGPFNEGPEIGAIAGVLKDLGFRVSTLTEVSRNAVKSVLKEVQPHVVHFIGHAAVSRGQGHLVFEQEGGRLADWITPRQLAELFPPSVGLLCLASPGSATNYQVLGFPRLANAPAEVRLPSMVVNQYDVFPGGSTIFWKEFYLGLRRDPNDPASQAGDLSAALAAARLALARSERLSDLAGFSLYIRDGTGRPFDMSNGLAADVDPERRALELEATFRARRANDLADQILRSGPDAAASLKEQFQTEQHGADQMLREINARPK